MGLRDYLPSGQFVVIVGSLLVAGVTVAAAQYYISSKNSPGALSAAAVQDGEWQESLLDIQAQSGISLPDAPSADTIDSFIKEAKVSNLTDSVGRGILARLTAAGTQGLGSDAPTQDSIIAAASQEINASYTQPEIPSIPTTEATEDTLRAYGNAVMDVMSRHPKASFNDTLGILAKATDTRDREPLAGLVAIGGEYAAIARELAGIPTPKTLYPLHREAVINMTAIGATYADMKLVVDDPMRGLGAVQKYQELMSETGRVFTNIAESLNKGGILFTKDEPGSAWEIFLSTP